jgi:hypothetical protein
MSEDLAGAERSGIDGPGLPETIRRLVAAYRPERIYLFGSRVREATERLRPLGSTVLMAAFRQRMDEEVREALGEEVERRAAGTERSA